MRAPGEVPTTAGRADMAVPDAPDTRSQPDAYASCTLAAFAVVSARDEALLGAVGLMIEPKLARAELGYWLGKAFWGRGYATEAAAQVLRFGFEELHLRRIHANHLADNPASGRVLERLGLTREGCLRQHARHRGAVHDVVMYAIVRRDTRSDLPATRSGSPPPHRSLS